MPNSAMPTPAQLKTSRQAADTLARHRARQQAQQQRRERERQLAAERRQLPLIAALRHQLRDLATSVAHQRHHNDLRDEVDEILFGIDKLLKGATPENGLQELR